MTPTRLIHVGINSVCVLCMNLECSLMGKELHSHTYYANTCLFKKFSAKFIEETV